MKRLIAVVFLLIILAIASVKIFEFSDKDKIVEVVRKAKKAFAKNDFEALTFFMDIRPNRKLFTLDDFQKIKKLTGREKELVESFFLPELEKNTEFIKLLIKDDWAAYYLKTDTDDLNYISVHVYLFHKVKGRWKICGYSTGETKRRPKQNQETYDSPTWKSDQDIENAINTKEKFNLENLKKEYFEPPKSKKSESN